MNRAYYRRLLKVFVFIALVLPSLFYSQKSYAICCWACPEADCQAGVNIIQTEQQDIRDSVKERFNDDLQEFERWMIEVFVYQEVAPAMGMMAEQMAVLAMYYAQMIGAFLDAQTQLDTQRLMRKLTFEAHNDYRISQGMCTFGTNVKSLAATDLKMRYNAAALSRMAMAKQLGDSNIASTESIERGYESRWRRFIDTHCDVRDNNFQSGGTAVSYDYNTGLALACDHDGPGGSNDRGAEHHKRINRDIDYTRLIEHKRTLELDMTDNSLDYDKSGLSSGSTTLFSSGVFSGVLQDGDEEDVIALSDYLYGNKPLSRSITDSILKYENAQKAYYALRSVAAKRNVAQSTFNAIVALKAAGTTETMNTGGAGATLLHPSGSLILYELYQTRRYMLAVMNELLPGDPASTAGNLFDLIGYSPSYYSQLELLAKRIYQNPDFYADLYGTPVNVKRKRVSMKAIELMLDRTIYESQLRREMTVSVLLSSKLRALHRQADSALEAGE